MGSQLPFFGLFLLDMVTQQAVAAWARQLGDPARVDPTRSPRTARRFVTLFFFSSFFYFVLMFIAFAETRMR